MVEPRSCKDNSNRKPTTKNKRRRQESLRKTQNKNQKPQQGKTGKASIKPMFDFAIDCSDAESKVGQRLSGVPPWETQHECTTELIGSDLVEHEKQGRHP